MALIVPTEARDNARVWTWLGDLVAGNGPIRQIVPVEVRQSMSNGGGPACLRLRVVADPATVDPRFLVDAARLDLIEAVVARYWPERIAPTISTARPFWPGSETPGRHWPPRWGLAARADAATTPCSADEPVADARLVADEGGADAVVLQFLADAARRHAQIFDILLMPRPPDIAQQLQVRDDAPGMLGELGEETEFLGRQMHFHPRRRTRRADRSISTSPTATSGWSVSADSRWRSAVRTRASTSSVSKGLVT